MRDIKFRAWDKEFSDMLSWEQLDNNDKEGLIHLFDILKGKEPNIIPMQYTGLKDKNGNEIYEGDIVTGWTKDNEVIEWDQANARFIPIWIQLWRDDIRDAKIKIIGNIYETPELLNP